MLRAPLHRDFRYIHEPLPVGDPAIPVLGHEKLVAGLKERLVYSRGGTFLVTGFRGVGKSTLVLRALAEVADEWSRRREGVSLLVVHLNLARTLTPDQLLFAIVRRLFETLEDRDLLGALPPEVRKSLLLSYLRTSLSFTQTQSESTERAAAVGLGTKAGAWTPTLGLNGTRMRGNAMEASFLAYSETDVEHDLVRVVQLLSGGHHTPPRQQPPPRRRPLLPWRGRRRLPHRVHPVIVLDETDKLTDNRQEAIDQLEELLGRLKNVLTMRGAHFIMVAGPDLHDRAMRDVERGIGLYESVFSWRMYVPCLWQGPSRLVSGVTSSPATSPPRDRAGEEGGAGNGEDADPLGDFVAYLRFKARGVPRRLLQEFNACVEWENGWPLLRLREEDRTKVVFYSRLDAIVAQAVAAGRAAPLVTVPIDEDRWRLGCYHVTDWALRSEGRSFTAEDVVAVEGDDQPLDPLLRMSVPVVERVLRHLVAHGVLEIVSRADRRDRTLYAAPAADAQRAYYALTEEYLLRLTGLARSSERERADLGMGSMPPSMDPLTTGNTTILRPYRAPEPPGSGAPPVSAGPLGSARPSAQPAGDASADDAYADDPYAPQGEAPHAHAPQGNAPDTNAYANANADDDGRRQPPSPSVAIDILDNRFVMGMLLGQGGMGAVHRGKDRITGEPVAIKVLNRSLRGSPDLLKRFRREAAVGRRLHHPNIVRTITWTESPEPALIMELIEGPTLGDVIGDHERLPPGFAALTARHIGEGLAHAHAAGIARLDLKPNNIIFDAQRGAVIVDLGLAHFLRDDPEQARLTQTGYVIGTPAYMSPEQVDGRRADGRSDLYTLGLLLYECVTGRPAREGSNVVATLRAHYEPVPVETLPASPEFRAVVGRLTEFDPEGRPQTAEEFLTALAATPEADQEMSLADLGPRP